MSSFDPSQGGSVWNSSDELANTAGSLDTGLSLLGELLGLADEGGVGELTGTENLEETLHNYYFKVSLTDLTTSITTALAAVEALRASSGTRVQILFRLMVGLWSWLGWRWK